MSAGSSFVRRKKGVIHVVDDERDIITVATVALEREGYTVHSFTNPKEALNDIEKRCKKKVSMLITDVRMPLHSGFEIARRTKDIVPDVPVVFMTAFEINSPEFDRLSLHSKSVTFCKNLSVRNN
ncbi:MAG: response regulator [Thermoproteota archaeon]|nr:response regulator [Thermoproteota archaeon]MDQ4067153.1 response regulator [Thermoproteota archaeon]